MEGVKEFSMNARNMCYKGSGNIMCQTRMDKKVFVTKSIGNQDRERVINDKRGDFYKKICVTSDSLC